MENMTLLKDPVLRSMSEVGHLIEPSGNVLEEIKDHNDIAGGTLLYCWISTNLGNQGRVCTLTVECQSNC